MRCEDCGRKLAARNKRDGRCACQDTEEKMLHRTTCPDCGKAGHESWECQILARMDFDKEIADAFSEEG